MTDLKKGTSFKLKKGYEDPAFPDIDTSNWQGRILAIVDGQISVEWDSITLDSFSDDYILGLVSGGYDMEEYFVEFEDIEITTPRDTAKDVEKALEKYHIFSTYTLHFEDSARSIFNLLDGADIMDDEEMLDAWYDYFTSDFKFPQNGIVTDAERGSVAREGDKIKVLDINEHIEYDYGLFADCKHEGNLLMIPLCDIELTSKSEAALIVHCYSTWFVNK
ncbi:MAG: calcium-binding protein [Arcicella sp.]|nr:calcium-binding protein [Arcicella sp.]